MILIIIFSFIVSFCVVFFVKSIIDIMIPLKKEEIDSQIRLVDISLDISETISHLLEKHNISESDFCKKLNISKETLLAWYSGVYDFKISQLTRIEAVFNEHIIKTILIERKKKYK